MGSNFKTRWRREERTKEDYITLQGIYSRKSIPFYNTCRQPIHFLKNENDSQLLLKFDRDDHHNFSPLLLLLIGCPSFVSPAHEIKITAVHNSTLQYYHSDYPLHFLTIFFHSGVHFSVSIYTFPQLHMTFILHLPELQLFTINHVSNDFRDLYLVSDYLIQVYLVYWLLHNMPVLNKEKK